MKDKTLLGLNLSAFLMMIGVGKIVALLPQRIIELDSNFSSYRDYENLILFLWLKNASFLSLY